MRKLLALTILMILVPAARAEIIASYVFDFTSTETANFWLSDNPANPEDCPKVRNAHSAILNTNSKILAYPGFREVGRGCWYQTKNRQIKLQLRSTETGKPFSFTYGQDRFETTSAFKGWGI